MLKWLYTALRRLAEVTGFGLLFQQPNQPSASIKDHKIERFTARSKQVLNAAYEEAQQTRHKYLMPEHVLLALFNAKGSVARQALVDLKVNQESVSKLVQAWGEVSAIEPKTEVELHPLTKELFALAVDEARRLKNPFVSTEHLLLGLGRQKNTATDILQGLEVSPNAVRQAVYRLLKQNSPFSLESYWLTLATMHHRIQDLITDEKITPEVGAELFKVLDFEVSDLEMTLALALPQLQTRVDCMPNRQIVFRQLYADETQFEMRL
ncbi:MAG TPA: Clp protease N-terminal domain-containing protein, partial [Phototrophicaceae bacterium]|nr:Clp protease N-terminal domain-containing protein [Phototrophicaceae bacterium]